MSNTSSRSRVGLVAGPLIVGRRLGKAHVELGRRTQRAIVALIVGVSAVTAVIEGVYRGNGGPFNGASAAEHTSGVTLLLIIASLVVLALADGLRRGRRLAWVIVTSVMAISFVGLLAVESSSERSADLVLVGAQLLVLLVTFPAFTSRAPLGVLRITGRRLIWVVVGLAVTPASGFAVLRDDFTPRAGWSDMVAEFGARLLFSIFRRDRADDRRGALVHPIDRRRLDLGDRRHADRDRALRSSAPTADTRKRQQASRASATASRFQHPVDAHVGTGSSSGSPTMTAPPSATSSSARWRSASPIPSDQLERRKAAIAAFDTYCFERGWIPCLFAAGQATADIAPALGWKAVEVAVDSVMLLDNVEFKGKDWQNVRTALNKAGKADIELVSMKWADCAPVITDQLRSISGEWVSDKALPEMGFTLGTLREAEDPEVRLHLAIGADRTVEGFTSWMPVSENGAVIGWTLDLMRRRDRGFRPVMEFLIVASARLFAEEGYRFICLSAAPLARPVRETATMAIRSSCRSCSPFSARGWSRITDSGRCSGSRRSSSRSIIRCSSYTLTKPRSPRSEWPSHAPMSPTPDSPTGSGWDVTRSPRSPPPTHNGSDDESSRRPGVGRWVAGHRGSPHRSVLSAKGLAWPSAWSSRNVVSKGKLGHPASLMQRGIGSSERGVKPT